MYQGANGLPDPATRQTFLAGATGPVFLTQGPDGALYYADLAGGTVRRIAADNNAPTARIVATPATGVAPLTVAFDGTTSTDPEGQALTYAWDLDGDGAYDDSTAAKPSFTYTAAGTVTVRLRVTDTARLAGHDVDDDHGRRAADGHDHRADERDDLGGRRHDQLLRLGAQQRRRDAARLRLRWSLDMRHCSRTDATVCHTHHIQDFVGVASGSFVAPDHEYPSHLELSLIATDAAGLSATQTVRLNPRTADLTLASAPSGLQLSLASETLAAPFTRTVIARSVTTRQRADAAGRVQLWSAWSDGLGVSHAITAPAERTATYTATFAESTDAALAGADAVGDEHVRRPPRAAARSTASPRSRTGPAQSLRLYLDASSRASKVVLGLYADAGGEAGALLGSATLTAPAAGAWNTRALSTPVPLVAGTPYWFGLLNPADSTGTLAWRDHAGGSGGLERTSASADADRPARDVGDRRPLQRRPGLRRGYGSATPLAARARCGAGLARARPRPRAVGRSRRRWRSPTPAAGPWLHRRATTRRGCPPHPRAGPPPPTVTLTADPAGLAPGTYTGHGHRHCRRRPATKTVPVTFTVAAPVVRPGRRLGLRRDRGGDHRRRVRQRQHRRAQRAGAHDRGPLRRALDFDGVNDWVTVNDSASLRLTTGMTLEGWAYPTGGRQLADAGAQGDGRRPRVGAVPVRRRRAAERPRRDRRDLWARGTAAPALNTWTHFAVTYDGADDPHVRQRRADRHPRPDRSDAHEHPAAALRRQRGLAGWFRGRLDEIRVYDRALSAAQIQADMARPVSSPTLLRSSPRRARRARRAGAQRGSQDQALPRPLHAPREVARPN